MVSTERAVLKTRVAETSQEQMACLESAKTTSACRKRHSGALSGIVQFRSTPKICKLLLKD